MNEQEMEAWAKRETTKATFWLVVVIVYVILVGVGFWLSR